MEIAADPQPSSLCFTKGTSSHTPAFSCGAGSTVRTRRERSRRPRANCLIFAVPRFYSLKLSKDKRQDDDAERDHNNPHQITVRDTTGGEVILGPAGTLSQLSDIFIGHLADSPIDFLVVDASRLQRFLPWVGGKKRSNGFFVRLAGLSWACRVFVQITEGNNVLLFLAPQWNCSHHENESSHQQGHACLGKKTHASSSVWLG